MKRFYIAYFSLVLLAAAITLSVAWFTYGKAKPNEVLIAEARETVEKLEKDLRDMEVRHWWEYWTENYPNKRYNLFFKKPWQMTAPELANMQNGETYAGDGSDGPFAERFVIGHDKEAILVNYKEDVLRRFNGDRERFRDLIWGLVAFLFVPVLFAWFAIRPLTSRIGMLERSTQNFADGNLATRVPIEGGDELTDLGTAFNRMAERVEALVSRNDELLDDQREMLRAVAHEFRNPLARIRFALDMSTDAGDRPIPELTQEMSQALDDLDSMVGEVLIYTRLQPGTSALALESVCIDDVVEDAVSNARAVHKQVQIKIDAEASSSAEVFADPYYLQRAVLNLVNNAARHAKERIVVRYVTNASRCSLNVDDDGPGVPVIYRSRIFEPFIRIDSSRSRHSGGAGLGLAIVQRIIEKHGGEASVDDSENLGGASFRLSWPIGTPGVEG